MRLLVIEDERDLCEDVAKKNCVCPAMRRTPALTEKRRWSCWR